ncbi:hypothetical protein K505DRAFT_39062 [Melanomma pulvis-pyrius CBS 109.77]|uniref:Uncharacterized protein n=1 Tax=Melanomma pulvis-pyrius CBS 109.77 TaxID=1314802 RepID=A0A6A6XBF6_9PLEO|nr:hypothetical protein K505DRAFT_39062 [Melanomma pulvis-pyrius CBS 109.77]
MEPRSTPIPNLSPCLRVLPHGHLSPVPGLLSLRAPAACMFPTGGALVTFFLKRNATLSTLATRGTSFFLLRAASLRWTPAKTPVRSIPPASPESHCAAHHIWRCFRVATYTARGAHRYLRRVIVRIRP